ncbi:MAG TPA: tetratricopeptide repeat protein, partial [Thermoanaerobaculia bacterium]|nr:tetratricopeptide repeat protein [Thermoanaerobaculia bacterium]
MEIFLIVLGVLILLGIIVAATPRGRTVDLASLLDQEQYEEVIEQAQRRITAGSSDVRIQIQRGEAARMLGRFDDAGDAFRAAVALDSRDPSAREGLAMAIVWSGGDLAEARSILEETIQRLPAIQEFQALELAWIALQQGRRDEALRMFEDQSVLLQTRFEMDYTDPDPLLAETLFLYAKLAREAGDEPAARTLFDRVIEWAPRSIFAR